MSLDQNVNRSLCLSAPIMLHVQLKRWLKALRFHTTQHDSCSIDRVKTKSKCFLLVEMHDVSNCYCHYLHWECFVVLQEVAPVQSTIIILSRVYSAINCECFIIGYSFMFLFFPPFTSCVMMLRLSVAILKTLSLVSCPASHTPFTATVCPTLIHSLASLTSLPHVFRSMCSPLSLPVVPAFLWFMRDCYLDLVHVYRHITSAFWDFLARFDLYLPVNSPFE